MNTPIRIDREDLYKQVWTEPVTKLAAKYGISDVGLSKICKKLNVPKPPRGYWAMIASGKRPPQKPLPKLRYGQSSTYVLHVSTAEQQTKEVSDEAHNLIATAEKLENLITVPKRLTDIHPLIEEMRDGFAKDKPCENGLICPRGKFYCDMRIAPENVGRALRIMDTVIKELEYRDFEIIIKKDKIPGAQFVMFGEELEIFLHEKVRRIDHVPTEVEKKKQLKDYWYSLPRWDYIPTGKLSIGIDAWGLYDIRKRWSDTKYRIIEDILNEFVIGVIRAADFLRKQRIEREEEQRRREEECRRREEERRRIEIEKAKLQELENQAYLWAKSKQLRAYIEAVEESASARQFDGDDMERLNEWIQWARNHADRFNPIQNGLPFENKC
ncbi:MAG: hypothetical protein JXB42_01855 [Deltaproteobacteria bacterium]|nr:hypothetical protein [Deltaproteobacteria bacterium]